MMHKLHNISLENRLTINAVYYGIAMMTDASNYLIWIKNAFFSVVFGSNLVGAIFCVEHDSILIFPQSLKWVSHSIIILASKYTKRGNWASSVCSCATIIRRQHYTQFISILFHGFSVHKCKRCRISLFVRSSHQNGKWNRHSIHQDLVFDYCP